MSKEDTSVPLCIQDFSHPLRWVACAQIISDPVQYLEEYAQILNKQLNDT